MNAAAALMLVFLAFPVLVAISAIWRGYVLSVLWGWFVVPLFGLPALSVSSAIGVSLVVGFLTYHHTKQKSYEDGKAAEAILGAVALMVLYPAATLGVGWVVKSFM